MKFQKILILIYLVVQGLLAQCIKQTSQLTALYIVLTILTTLFFLLSYFKDVNNIVKQPGYLLVDQVNMQLDQRQKAELKTSEVEDDNYVASGKEIMRMPPAGVSNNKNTKNENIMEYNENLQHLGFSKSKNKKKRDSRYCGICMINQPYRTRHCHQCEKCVATYDHHCPWINNCVGEKNRHYYFLFLVLQTIQIFNAAVLVCSSAVNKINAIKSEWILGISLIIFLSVIIGLTVFHTYLMLFNVTTWELSRWDSIPYLSKYERSKQYPFSKGIIRNIKQYWTCAFRKTRKIWQFQN